MLFILTIITEKRQPIQMHRYDKPKTFSKIFVLFPEFTKNLEHFEKKIEPRSLSILEIIKSEKRGYLNA